MDIMLNNYCLNFQSSGRSYGAGLLRSNPILKPKCYSQMTTLGVFQAAVSDTIPIVTYSNSIRASSSSSSHHQARSPKSDPYNHSQQFYPKELLGLKTDKSQSLPLEIPTEEEETHFHTSSDNPDELESGFGSGRVRDRDGVPASEQWGIRKEESLELEMDNPDRIRPRKQMMKRSTMIAKQVISIQSALNVGFVSQLWVDTTSWTVLIVDVRPSLLSGEMERLLLKDIAKVGDVLLIEDESTMENNFKLLGLETLVGYTVVTPGRQSIGKVRGYTFDINSGAVESLELDSFGISIIPSSLVSTYGLFVEDVVEVSADTVVVHEAAASRIQRLTKGFWGSSKMKKKKKRMMGKRYSEEYLYSEDGNGKGTDSEYGERRKRELFSSKKFVGSEKVEDWELPMDYL